MWLIAQIAPFLVGDTGSIRDLEHVLWGVRLTVLLSLVHWKLRSQDAWTIAPVDLHSEARRLLSSLPAAAAVQL